MDESSISQLTSQSLLIAPTGSLVTYLQEVFAAHQIQQGQQAWESPNIVSWKETMRQAWRFNQAKGFNFETLISTQQARLLWTHVVDQTARSNNELTLLNVPQTVRACMRSHRLLSDWRCDDARLMNEHIEDLNQFVEWRNQYLAILNARGLADDAVLQSAIIEAANGPDFIWPFTQTIWYAYDLLTAAQREFNDCVERAGDVAIEGGPRSINQSSKFVRYEDSDKEIYAVFKSARRYLDLKPDAKVAIVVPDLQHRYAKVQQIAHDVFYPNSSLLDSESNQLVYRFSLGKPMIDVPAIEAVFCALSLLKNNSTLDDIQFLLNSSYLTPNSFDRKLVGLFIRWLSEKRILRLAISECLDLFNEFLADTESEPLNETLECQPLISFFQVLAKTIQELLGRLNSQFDESGFKALRFDEWVSLFQQWLDVWGWSSTLIQNEQGSQKNQLFSRWESVLQDFSALNLVQQSSGLHGALSHLKQLLIDSVYLPKSASSPIYVSGLLEALGRETDMCFLTAMKQDFPAPNRPDSFVPNHLLVSTGLPDASPQLSSMQSRKVIQGLINSCKTIEISYPLYSSATDEVVNSPSPLFLSQFHESELIKFDWKSNQIEELDYFVDTQGPSWSSPEKARGGSAIFKNQSHCPFKAFVTHQLRFDAKTESEFGLNHLDRGNLIHKMMELVWAYLPSQKALLEMDSSQQDWMLNSCFEELLIHSAEMLNDSLYSLFKLEKTRIKALATEWLDVERKRPCNFSVVERESRYTGEWAEIRFDYVVDRVDVTEAGESIVIDYKTGLVNRSGWQGDRLKEPQLPLYALARNAKKANKLSGITFAQMRRGESLFVEMAEAGILKTENHYSKRYQEQWQHGMETWPDQLTELAKEFLQGKAQVNPIDETVCQFCDLGSVCRINQLRAQSSNLASVAPSDGVNQ